MKFYVYILQSEVDASFYIGYSADLSQRIDQHNSGLSQYTSTKRPWRLVYFEDFDDKTTAVQRERFLKKMKNRDFILRLIHSLDD